MAQSLSVTISPELARRIRVAGALDGQSMTRKASSILAQWLRAPSQVSAVSPGPEQVKLTLTAAQVRATRVAAAEGGWDSASALARAVLHALCPHEMEAVISTLEST